MLCLQVHQSSVSVRFKYAWSMTALLALLLLGVVRAGEEVAVEVVTYRRAPRGLLVGLLKVHSQ